MSRIILILESAYSKGQYYRVGFIMDSIRQSGLSARLYACGGAHDDEERTLGWEIRQSKVLRLLNFLVYLVTLRSFAHFGFLLRMWPSLVAESPQAIVFYSNWTGLFLLFWRKLTGSQARLVWEWYDLNMRMRYHGRRMGAAGKILLHLEERIAPSYFDGLIVPTRFAQQLVHSWGQSMSKIHVLGEVRELNAYVSPESLERRIEEVHQGEPVQIVWVGVIRHYQLEGLTQFLLALMTARWVAHRMVIHLAGPIETATDGLRTLAQRMPPGITVQLHQTLSPDALDRLLAQTHAAVHPLPDELFCEFIYSRKMADYLAASLPVAFSAVGGLKEIGEKFGVPFHLGDSRSVAEALGLLSNPDHYEKYLLRARNVALQEYSHRELKRKGRSLVDFLRGVSESAKTFTSFRQDEAVAKIET